MWLMIDTDYSHPIVVKVKKMFYLKTPCPSNTEKESNNPANLSKEPKNIKLSKCKLFQIEYYVSYNRG